MSPFFPLLGIHLEILTVALAHPPAFAFLCAATKVDLTPRVRFNPALLLFLYPPAAPAAASSLILIYHGVASSLL